MPPVKSTSPDTVRTSTSVKSPPVSVHSPLTDSSIARPRAPATRTEPLTDRAETFGEATSSEMLPLAARALTSLGAPPTVMSPETTSSRSGPATPCTSTSALMVFASTRLARGTRISRSASRGPCMATSLMRVRSVEVEMSRSPPSTWPETFTSVLFQATTCTLPCPTSISTTPFALAARVWFTLPSGATHPVSARAGPALAIATRHAATTASDLASARAVMTPPVRGRRCR
jgi:hypothetical protein